MADLNVPVLVQACDDENDKVDLDSRYFCGKISVCNNLYQYGIPYRYHATLILYPITAKDINKFAGICRVVNGLRHARIGAIGAQSGWFPLYVQVRNCYRRVALHQHHPHYHLRG